MISVAENLPISECLFETASAVGTVGLTLGITPQARCSFERNSDRTDVSWKGWRSDACLCCDAGEKERTCKNAAGKNKCRIRREEEMR